MAAVLGSIYAVKGLLLQAHGHVEEVGQAVVLAQQQPHLTEAANRAAVHQQETEAVLAAATTTSAAKASAPPPPFPPAPLPVTNMDVYAGMSEESLTTDPVSDSSEPRQVDAMGMDPGQLPGMIQQLAAARASAL